MYTLYMYTNVRTYVCSHALTHVGTVVRRLEGVYLHMYLHSSKSAKLLYCKGIYFCKYKVVETNCGAFFDWYRTFQN